MADTRYAEHIQPYVVDQRHLLVPGRDTGNTLRQLTDMLARFSAAPPMSFFVYISVHEFANRYNMALFREIVGGGPFSPMMDWRYTRRQVLFTPTNSVVGFTHWENNPAEKLMGRRAKVFIDHYAKVD